MFIVHFQTHFLSFYNVVVQFGRLFLFPLFLNSFQQSDASRIIFIIRSSSCSSSRSRSMSSLADGSNNKGAADHLIMRSCCSWFRCIQQSELPAALCRHPVVAFVSALRWAEILIQNRKRFRHAMHCITSVWSVVWKKTSNIPVVFCLWIFTYTSDKIQRRTTLV